MKAPPPSDASRPTFGPLVSTCKAYGIPETSAWALVRDNLLDTFLLGRVRMVYLHSLDSLPARLPQGWSAMPGWRRRDKSLKEAA